MPIDPAGMAPGLAPKSEELPKVHMRCPNPSCKSMTAYEVQPTGQGSASSHRLYRCTDCNLTRAVSTGGEFPF